MKQIRLSKRGALALLLAAALALAVGAGLNNLNRALGAMAAARARQLVTDALNSAVESASATAAGAKRTTVRMIPSASSSVSALPSTGVKYRSSVCIRMSTAPQATW